MDNLTLKVIARIYTDFGEKFGVPRFMQIRNFGV